MAEGLSAELIKLAESGAQAFVTAMAADTWPTLKARLSRVFRTEEQTLDNTREQYLGAEEDKQAALADQQRIDMTGHLRRLMEQDPAFAKELHALISELPDRADFPPAADPPTVNTTESQGSVIGGVVHVRGDITINNNHNNAPPAPTQHPTGSATDPPSSRSDRRLRSPAVLITGIVTVIAVAAMIWHPWTRWTPTPHGTSPSGTPSATPSAPLGHALWPPDPRTANPCALALPAQTPLAPFGHVKHDANYGNFDRCDLLVDLPDGSTQVDLEFQFQKAGPPVDAVSTVRTGSVTVARQALDNGECDRTLSPPGPYTIDVSAKVPPGQQAELCRMADVATNAAVTVLNGGQVLPQRAFPSDSLANLHACQLLDTSALTRVGGDPSAPSPEFGDWQCRWDTASGYSVNLLFDQGPVPSPPGDGSLIQLGGRTAFVQPDGDGGGDNCVVEIEYRSFTDNGSQMMELVRLVLGGPQPPVPSASLCTPAEALAADAITNLGS